MDRLTVSVREMAQMLGIGVNKAYELAGREDFPAIHVGKKIIIPIEALKRWTAQAGGYQGQ